MRDRRFKLKPYALVAASVALIFSQAPSWANPTGPQVVNGAVSFQQPAAGVLNVTNSPGSIINWQGFSIGASEITRFIQQSASSAVLNRVTGGNVSQIYGQLLSNGRVFLVNPGGIVVGPGAIVDTAGFVGSTLNMLDSDFLAGKLKFQGDSSSGSIINQGWIRTGYGGQVVLVAPSIENSGLIHTPGGELILAAGQKVAIASLDHEGVQFEVQAPTDTVVNVGKLLADGGAVGVFAGTLRHTGEIRANALVYDEAGRIVLKAQNEIQLASGSATSADGKAGGSVTVQSGGLTRVAGDVSATGSAGRGGAIELLGSQVAVVGAANVDASGSAGGGRILVGGDYQGANPAIQNSTNIFVGSAATLRADATQSGEGGRIIVWSDDRAQFYGSLSAQGGPEGGNGGFAEVSGKQGLVFQGSANLGAPKGQLGSLLLDPLDQYVFNGGGLDPTIIDETTDFPANAATVSPATLAAITGNVTLFASRYMRISDPITLTTAGQGLTATVGTYTAPAAPDPLSLATNTQINNIPNQLEVRANITTAGGPVTLNAPVISGPAAATIATSGGAIGLTSTVGAIQASSLALNAGTGAVNATSATSLSLGAVGGGSFTATAPSSLSIGAITSGSGAVSLTSTGSGVFTSTITTSGGGVTASAGSSASTGNITAGAGNVALSGTSVSAGIIDNTGTVNLTASNGTVFASRVDAASSLTATSTSATGSAQVFIGGSLTVLNATNVTATAGSCFSSASCPSASVTLNAAGPVNIGTVSASAPATTQFGTAFGATYADPKFENRNETVSISSSGGSIRATSATSSITGMNVSLSTGLLSGGGIGQLTGTPLPVRVDVGRALTLNPNGEFNVQLIGSGPNNLNMQVGVAPTGQSYTGSLSKTGLTLNVSATDTGVTATTFDILSGFDQRVFNGSPGITFRVPNGSFTAATVNVPAGDQTGTASPTARHNCDTLGGAFCPAPLTIEPLAVVLRSSGDLSIGTYTRAAGTVAKSTQFLSDSGSVTLGTVNASRDPVTIAASAIQPSTSVSITGGLTTTGAVNISAPQGNVTLNSVNTSGGPGAVTISALGTVGAPSSSNTSSPEIQAGTASVTINAGTIGNSANSFPLDIVAGSVSLTSTSGAIGFAGAPVQAIAQTLAVNSATTFNVDTSTVNLKNLTVTASPLGAGAGGLATVTSNGTTYNFASDGANFTVGGGSFAAVPAAQFAGGTLSFTSTSGNLTLNALDFSASNGNFSATTNGGATASITQTPGQPINLGSGALTVKANGSVTLESLNAGGLTATNATTTGCTFVGGVNSCGVATFTGNQTFTDTANAGGTWSVTSRGAITTQALQVGGINFSAASGNVATGAIGTAARPITSATITTNGTSAGGNIQVNGAIEADNLTLTGRGTVTVGTGTLPADQATPLINATNTDAASINLLSQTAAVTVNGVMNASSIRLTSPTSINTGNVNAAAATPGSVSFIATSGATAMNTGSLDGTSIVMTSGCLFCSPGNILVNGAIGAATTKPTNISMFANSGNSVVIAGNITMDPAAPGSLFIGAGTTLTGIALAPLGVVTAGDGSSITLNAGNAAIATPFLLTRVDAGPTGSVSMNAPAGIVQATNGASDGIRAGTVSLSAGSTGSVIAGTGISPTPLTLRETAALTISTGGSIHVDRTGASGAPLLTNLNITRSSNTFPVTLTGFAAGNAVGISNDTIGGGAFVDVVNTSATPLNFSYTNNDGLNNALTVTATGIATKGGSVSLNTGGLLTTGVINTKSGSGTVPDGQINLFSNQTISVSGTVDSGGGALFAQGNSISGSGQLASTNNVFAQASSGNIGSGATPLAVSAPTVTLQAFGANPNGNVFASLTGTTGLTVNASDGFTITGNTPLTSVNLTTNGTGVGPVSLTTTGAQSFGLARNGTSLDITGVSSTPTMGTFGLSVNSGSINVKGGIAAGTLNLSASSTLTLDGSTSALTLSNGTQTLFGSGGVVIQGDVTASATTSQTISSFGNLSFTGRGALTSAGSQNISSSGNTSFTTSGGAITLSAASNQSINAFGNLDFTATGGAISVTGANQSISVSGANSVMTLQGGGAAGQSVTVTGSTTQTIQSPDNTTSFIQLLGGFGSDASAKILYTGTGTQLVQGGNVVLTGGFGTNASALISTATGTQRVRANKDIILTGGEASGAVARIENTSANTQRVGESEFIPSCCSEPYQTDNVMVQGGLGAEAAIVAAGLQKIQANNAVRVLGGSGSGGSARIETTTAGIEQRIGCFSGSPVFESCSNTLDTLDVIAGTSGATAQIFSAGTQRLRGTSNLTMTGNANNGGFARIVTTGTAQVVQFSGTDAITAGTGAGSDASILSAGTQDFQFGALSLTAGGAGSVAKLSAAGTQNLSASSINLTAKGTAASPVANASAIIEGQNQSISAGAITLTGGSGVSGSTSDALLRNTAGAQLVGASSITMTGGHTLSTTGILNQGTGTQTINASGGITMRSDTTSAPALADAFVLIQNTPSTDQNLNAGLTLTNSGAGTVAITTPAKQTIIANAGGISITSQGTDPASVTKVAAGGDQLIRARFVDVQTAAGSVGDASLAATGNQWIHTTLGSLSGTSIAGAVSGISLRAAAKGSGTASITAGASQLLELDYPEQFTQGSAGGVLMVGDTAAAGTSRIAAVDQNVFARSVVIQGPAGAGKNSELKASGTQVITTLQGPLQVFGGSGNNTIAQIDPINQTILVNGEIEVIGGSGTNAIAQIVNGSGTQTIIATNGSIFLEGGTGLGADALITSLGTQTIGTTGSIVVSPVIGGGNALISPLGSPPPGCASPCLLTSAGSSSTSTVIGIATTPILTAEQNLEQTLLEITPEGIGQEAILTRRAPVCR